MSLRGLLLTRMLTLMGAGMVVVVVVMVVVVVVSLTTVVRRRSSCTGSLSGSIGGRTDTPTCARPSLPCRSIRSSGVHRRHMGHVARATASVG